MPEAAEVEIIKRSLENIVKGKSVTRFSSLHPRYAISEKDLPLGSLITAVNRRGKFILVEINYTHELIVHLGMTGQVLTGDANSLHDLKHVHFQLELDDHTHLLFRDPRRFGRLTVVKKGQYRGLLAELGPDIGQNNPIPVKSFRTKKAVFTMLLEQKAVAGVGSYLAQEALFLAGVRPDTPCYLLDANSVQKITASIQEVYALALSQGGLSFSDFRHTDGSSGKMLTKLQVYGRAGHECKICQSTITTIKLASRTASFCEDCQQ